MSGRIPMLKAKDIIKNPWIFLKCELKVRIYFLKHPGGRVTLVPKHGGGVLGPGLIRQILREIKITSKEFSRLL